MEKTFEYRFAIRRMISAYDKDYSEAIKIYNTVTPIDIRTNNNEITYWLENNQHENTFEIFIFSLRFGAEIVGMAMLSYIKKQKLIIYDYISLKDGFRLNAAFFAFISLIQQYFKSINYSIDYYINEISNKDDGASIDKESKIFKKIICLEGFGMVGARYLTPALGVDNFESSFDAHIYIKSNDLITKISRKTIISIIEGIYYEYYWPWYKAVLSEDVLQMYKKDLDEKYHKVISALSESQNFDIIYPQCAMQNYLDEKTYGDFPTEKEKKLSKIPFILIGIFICPLLLIWAYSILLEYLKIPLSSANSTLGAFLGALITSTTAYFLSKK